MVVRREGRAAVELAREQPRRERHPYDHADVTPFRLLEEQLRGPLSEHVEDDLDGGDARVLDRLQRLLDLLDADPVGAHEAVLDQPVAGLEHGGRVVRLPRRAVQLDEVDDVDAEVLARALEPDAQVLLGVVLHPLLDPAPELGRDHERLVPLAEQPADQPLRAAVAVDVGGVEERDPGVDGGVERVERLRVVGLAPRAADRPGSEPDLRDGPAGLAEEPRPQRLTRRRTTDCMISAPTRTAP